MEFKIWISIIIKNEEILYKHYKNSSLSRCFPIIKWNLVGMFETFFTEIVENNLFPSGIIHTLH